MSRAGSYSLLHSAVPLLLHPFVHSFPRLFAPLPLHSFIYPFLNSFIPSLFHSPLFHLFIPATIIHSLRLSFVPSSLRYFIPPPLHPVIPSSPYSFIPSFPHSFIPSFLHTPITHSVVNSFLRYFIISPHSLVRLPAHSLIH